MLDPFPDTEYVLPGNNPDLDRILHSGDPELIARSLGVEVIIEHFGEESSEFYAAQRRSPISLLDVPQKKREYLIPRTTENPGCNYGMLRRWIIDFHQRNDMALPKGFYKRNKHQLQGMFYGMLREYDITLDRVVRSKSD